MSDEKIPSSSTKRREFLRGVGAVTVGVASGLGAVAGDALAQGTPPAKPTGIGSKPPTKATLEANAVYAHELAFNDTQDFQDASRGLIGTLPSPGVIPSSKGGAAWDLGQFDFITGGPENNAPDSVNPSLWRNAKLNMNHGLFEVVDGIWQVRGYDLSVMSIIRGDTGWIVIDPLMTADVSAVVWKQLVVRHLGDRPITHVIYTHSHADHYGGIRGIVDEADLKSGKIKIYAPEGFTEAAVGENVIAGNAMSRRAAYMYGNLLPRGVDGVVDAGLGKTTSIGAITLVVPTDFATGTGQTLTMDGVEMKVIMAPESEAPSEFMFYIPKYKAFCAAEDATHTLHNLYTLRGAKVRDVVVVEVPSGSH